MNDWTSTPPTEPGVYEWSDGKGGETEVRMVITEFNPSPNIGRFNGRCVDWSNHEILQAAFPVVGYWRKYVGEKYEAPKPPKVQLFTARHGNELHIIMALGKFCTAYRETGECVAVWDEIAKVQACGYTDIQPYKPE